MATIRRLQPGREHGNPPGEEWVFKPVADLPETLFLPQDVASDQGFKRPLDCAWALFRRVRDFDREHVPPARLDTGDQRFLLVRRLMVPDLRVKGVMLPDEPVEG